MIAAFCRFHAPLPGEKTMVSMTTQSARWNSSHL